jgi:hypothetical protein
MRAGGADAAIEVLSAGSLNAVRQGRKLEGEDMDFADGAFGKDGGDPARPAVLSPRTAEIRRDRRCCVGCSATYASGVQEYGAAGLFFQFFLCWWVYGAVGHVSCAGLGGSAVSSLRRIVSASLTSSMMAHLAGSGGSNRHHFFIVPPWLC